MRCLHRRNKTIYRLLKIFNCRDLQFALYLLQLYYCLFTGHVVLYLERLQRQVRVVFFLFFSSVWTNFYIPREFDAVGVWINQQFSRLDFKLFIALCRTTRTQRDTAAALSAWRDEWFSAYSIVCFVYSGRNSTVLLLDVVFLFLNPHTVLLAPNFLWVFLFMPLGDRVCHLDTWY